MLRRIVPSLATVAAAAVAGGAAPTQLMAQARQLPTIADRTAGMTAKRGYFNLYWDEATGKLFWEIDKLGTEFLYQVTMASGLGSTPIGIDRGQLGSTAVLVAKRTGPRVLLTQPNYRFQARNARSAAERAAVTDAFAPSVQWGFDIVAQTGNSVLVDATAFFMRDARGVIEMLEARQQGRFQLDLSRSTLEPEIIKAFPENDEIEATLTFTSGQPGPLVNGAAASGKAITLREHHSLVKLPGPGFKPRFADPRLGVSGQNVMDFSQPINEDIYVRYAARHRLQKKNPAAARSEPVKPIVYYIDPGTPEPVRTALADGVRWWNQAFEAAGYINAFRVEILPDSADPDDIRYNMVHWTHGQTRGYSYGSTVVDPRTGEIVRGNVNLGSLRLQQDFLHGAGLVAPFGASGDDDTDGFADAPSAIYLAALAENGDALKLALDRVRQLGAHEVGHTLGFPHNYIGSATGRSTVMDYPAPLVKITPQGTLDLSDAYDQKIGDYDKMAIAWLYQDFPPGTDEKAALDRIIDDGYRRGLRYVGYKNNTFVGAAAQYASVWDNGANLVDQLKIELQVRQIGLDKFGPQVIPAGTPMSDLEYVLLPLYMHHRFQLRSAAQSIGGMDYGNAIRGGTEKTYTIVPGAEQRRALDVILSTLGVDFTAIPQRIVAMIPPSADRHTQGETFEARTDNTFDPLAAAEASASFTVGEILNPERMARLVSFGAMGDYPTLEEVVDKLIAAVWDQPAPADRYRLAVQRTIQRAVVDQMMLMGMRADNGPDVRAVLSDRLNKLAKRLESQAATNDAQRFNVAADIRRWENRTVATIPGPALKLPPGDPIGAGGASASRQP